MARIKKLILNSFVYHVWRERNNIIFQSKYSSADQVGYAILSEVKVKMLSRSCKVGDSPQSRCFMERLQRFLTGGVLF